MNDYVESIGMAFGAAAMNDARGWGLPRAAALWAPLPSGIAPGVVQVDPPPPSARPPSRSSGWSACGAGWNFEEEEDLEDYL